MELSDIDLLNRDVFTRGVPHDWFTYLRNNAPIYHHEEPDGGPGFWVITKYKDVYTVGRDAHTYSSDGEAKIMLSMDPPQHTRYRKLVNKGFTPRMIAALEPLIRQRTTAILDAAMSRGECDFVVDVAAELPLQAIAELMGVPFEDRHKLFDWSNRTVGSEDPEYKVAENEAFAAQFEMFGYASDLAAQRKQEPRDDIMTALLNAELDGDKLTEMEFNLFFMLLAVAGNETTRNAISHGLNAFLEHPDQWSELVEDVEGAIGTATEEILRWASPVMYFRRNVMHDTSLSGVEFKAGEKVSIWYCSANRDEDVFADPFNFDIRRQPNEHLAFGGGGPHFCLGASLARMEIKVLFEELAQRAPRISRRGPTAALRSNFIGGIKHLPMAFSA
jgi:cholest-4-en-3-one 26-monooxygenase